MVESARQINDTESSSPDHDDIQSSSTESDLDDPLWKSELSAPSMIHPFTDSHPTGPAVPVPEMPKEIFELYFTPELISMIVEQTNKYAREVSPPDKEWAEVTRKELYAFLGFQLLMGLNPKPSVKDYWRKDQVYHYGPISDRITRDRYLDIQRYLHFVDNSTLSPPNSPSYDRLGKVKPLITYITEKCKSLYNPGREIAVDEAMIKFQGRSSLKQYMPLKPIRRGIKVWVLGDSSNGYFSRLEVYTGRKESIEHGLGARVVKTLTKDFQQSWRYVYFDNFFTSKALLLDLLSLGLYGCGTVRSNRKGFPVQLKKPKLKKR